MSKKYVVVDAEFHCLSLEAIKKAAVKVKPSEGVDLRRQIKNPDIAFRKAFDLEFSVRHMEECGVDMALVGTAPWIIPGLTVCKAINDGLAEMVKEYPGKFIPLAHVPYIVGRPAIDELDRAINGLGLKGVTVLTFQQDVRLDDKRLRPFFNKVSQLRVPVMVHPTVKVPVWGGDKYFMSGSVSREYDIIKAFVEVLFGVLPEFPDLNFLFAHFGGGVPFLLGRIMSWYTPEKSGIPKDKIGFPKTINEFEDYGLKKEFNKLLDQIYFNMAGTGGWMPAVKQALLAIKADRLCFATDYPWEMSRPRDLKSYINGIKRLDIPEKSKAKVLGENIRRLFRA